jgi:hypothetical protein
MNNFQKIVFLNVPAPQSRNYFDYLHSNMKESIVFVDALFGGLDVVARLRWTSDYAERLLIEEIGELARWNRPEEATVAHVLPFLENEKFKERENFIIVICRQKQDMREARHQNSFLAFVKRKDIEKNLRFVGVVINFDPIEDVSLPHYLAEDIKRAGKGEVLILEFSVSSLDDPRRIVMDSLQQFDGVDATRTFFGVNYGALKNEKPKPWKKLAGFAKEWAGPLLSIRRLWTGV